MAEVHQKGGGGDAFDLTQFSQIFFEEAGENLDLMEQMLLNLNLETADDEILNAIFRCVHSVKGGAATFGFSDVSDLTHEMESLLDRLRRHELKPNCMLIDALLESTDVSRGLLSRHQTGVQGPLPPTADLMRRIRELTVEKMSAHIDALAQPPPRRPTTAGVSTPAMVTASLTGGCAPAVAGMRVLLITIGPLANPDEANAVCELFRDIPGLGEISQLPSERADARNFEVATTSTDEDLLDLFAFYVSRDQVIIKAVSGPVQEMAHVLDGPAVVVPLAAFPGFGFFDGAPGEPSMASVLVAASGEQSGLTDPAGKAAVTTQPEAATIRVAINKVDQLINLVGELLITQAMLAQSSRALDPAVSQSLLKGLADLDRNTRALQESAISIRMIAMSVVFSRFPRMIRDLASKLGKKIKLVTQGEAIELDKDLFEKITDPLTHLVRNSCDHGVEMPADRVARGKPETGTITLSASHQGASVVIEVRDDGRGLSREKILAKARESGLDIADSLSDSEVWALIFAPGFSTAAVVTNVSGRGVGMDVVKRNITALHGSVEIASSEGYGMQVLVRLPLTLAIMDAMSVGVGDEVFILPLSSVVESIQVKAEAVSTLGLGSPLVKVRGEFMPFVELEKVFRVSRMGLAKTGNIMVVIEADGLRVALLVDELLGQQRIVVRSLEPNYRRLPNVSGATILSNGKVAFILDPSALVRRSVLDQRALNQLDTEN